MEHVEYRCLTGSSSAGENAERLMERHRYSSPLPSAQAHLRTILKVGYRPGNDRRWVDRKQISFRSGNPREQLAETVRDGLFHYGGSERLVTIPGNDDGV